jgi:type I restriction enzyme S subunit
MSRWSTKRLSELAESVDYGVTASASGRPLGPKFLRITDIQNGAVNWETVPWCECDSRSASFAQLRTGDIVFARTGATTGKSFLIRECPTDAVFASYLIRVRLGVNADPRFVSHFFQTGNYWAQITKNARGAAQPGVNATTLKNIEIPLPPLDEQHRIAGILDKADRARAKRHTAIAFVDTLAESIFLEMFGDPVANSKRWPDSTTLGEVAEIVSGVTKGRSLEGRATRLVPYLAVVNVQDRKLNLSVVKTIDATQDEIDRYRLLPDDLLLTEGGDPDKLGRGTLWKGEIPECIHQNHIFRVRVISTAVLHPLFLSWLVGSKRGKRYFLRSAKQTTGIASINMTQLRAFPLLLPPMGLQAEFARRMAGVEGLRAKEHGALTNIDELFACLQYHAFRGEL